MNKPVSRQSNLVVQDLEKELLIYDLKNDKALCLNKTSALVWQLCNGNNSIADISNLISRKLNTAVSEDFVWLALDGLRKEKLLENEGDLENHPAGLSRREVVKKVGLASMVTLPIISSITAPTSIMAQSVCGNLLAPCSSNPECCNGNCVITPEDAFSNHCCVDNLNFAPNHLPGIPISICLDAQTDCQDFLTNVLGGGCCSGMAIAQPTDCGVPGGSFVICVCE